MKNTSRRDLLKFFAAGAVITPLSGEASARLIETPKIELIVPDRRIVQPFDPADVTAVDVAFTMKDGSIRRMKHDWMLVDVLKTNPHYAPTPAIELHIQVRHRFLNSPSGTFAVADIHTGGTVRNRSAVVELV